MNKKYKENNQLEEIIKNQQEEIDNLKWHNQIQSQDIDYWRNVAEQPKETDRAILTVKFLTDILYYANILEKILGQNNTLANILLPPIVKFKYELCKSMLKIKYDGKDGYSYEPSLNDDDNDEDLNDDESDE